MSQNCCTAAQYNKTCPLNNYLWCSSCQNNQCQQECKTCNSLIQNCVQCDCVKFLCLKCNDGYQISNLATQCKAVTLVNQSAANSTNSNTKQYTPSSNDPSNFTKPCNGTNLICMDGYYFDVSKTCACQKCCQNCLKCYNSQSCEQCAPDTYIHTGFLYQDILVCYRDKNDMLVSVDTNTSTKNLGFGWNYKRCWDNILDLAFGVRCLTYEEMCIVEKYCKAFYAFATILRVFFIIFIQ